LFHQHSVPSSAVSTAVYTSAVSTAVYTSAVSTAVYTSAVSTAVYTSAVSTAVYTSAVSTAVYTSAVSTAVYTTLRIFQKEEWEGRRQDKQERSCVKSSNDFFLSQCQMVERKALPLHSPTSKKCRGRSPCQQTADSRLRFSPLEFEAVMYIVC